MVFLSNLSFEAKQEDIENVLKNVFMFFFLIKLIFDQNILISNQDLKL